MELSSERQRLLIEPKAAPPHNSRFQNSLLSICMFIYKLTLFHAYVTVIFFTNTTITCLELQNLFLFYQRDSNLYSSTTIVIGLAISNYGCNVQ